MKYTYEFFDGEEWLEALGEAFATPEEAKMAGVDSGFEYVRVVPFVPITPSSSTAGEP